MMTITEHQRNQLRSTLTNRIGAEEADALMELLPPAGWADVARRSDVELLGQEIALAEARLQEQMHKDMRDVYKAMSRMTWTMTVSMIGAVVASAGFAFIAGVAL